MSDKIQKFLKLLNAKELARVSEALRSLDSGMFDGLNIKALKGKPGYIRVRVGRVRIVCRQLDGKYKAVHITNRNEKTYKNL